MSKPDDSSWVWIVLIVLAFVWFINRDKPADISIPVQRGNPALHGGSPTVRRPFIPSADDPSTSNDESNDQPLGYFGTHTILAHSVDSGNTYTLNADIDGDELTRLYFPKGGWVDFVGCELEEFQGECEDEEGRQWVFEGEG